MKFDNYMKDLEDVGHVDIVYRGEHFIVSALSKTNHLRGIKVKYVHELQQVLRLCGLRELADNFKVKEG